MALDVKYVKERSFLVDWKIIFATFRAVLFGHGESFGSQIGRACGLCRFFYR